jgi:N-acyl-D-aspartate/D-glutamate deacylase
VIDHVIRNGTVVDGTGAAPRVADVGIEGERITAVEPPGRIPPAPEETDARDRVVTPGFIDPHSHLDGSVVWESRLTPASGHGITSTVIGNCGVGFAPCRAEHRDFTMDLMEGIEDIPRSVLDAGLPWTWASYPDYLGVLAGRHYDMDVAGLVPHSCVRVDAMGVVRATDGSAATASERRTMHQRASEALEAGAVGIGSTRLVGQQTRDGRPAPSRFADREELMALARAISAAGHGVLQIAPEFNRFPLAVEELGMIIGIAEETGVPVTYTLKQTTGHPDGWRELLDLTAAAVERGVRIHPQVLARPTGVIVTLESSRHRFATTPTFRGLADRPLDQVVEAMDRPEVRAAVLAEAVADRDRFERLLPQMFPIGAEIDYEPDADRSVAALARGSEAAAEELIYDHLLSGDGTGALLVASGNYAEGNLDFAREMLLFPTAVPGLGDAGAHCSVMCDASATTTLLSYWTRDRARGERLALPWVIKKMTADLADLFGLADRGRIEPGYRADVNVIDVARLGVGVPRGVHDLPAGGRRMVQDATGYDATIVAGRVVVRHDDDTGARPGAVIRAPVSPAGSP